VGRSSRPRTLEHAIADSLGTGRGVLITGAGGQLGTALRHLLPDADAPRLDVTNAVESSPRLALHAAAWTDVDAAEADPEAARRVNVVGTRNIVALGAPVVYFSTDYVFDGRKGAPYVESDEPDPLSVYGRTKLEGEREVGVGWIVRSSWLFGATGKNFVRTMLELGRERDEVRVVADQRGCPTYVGHLALAIKQIVDLPQGIWHVAADGDCTWATFADAIFAEAGISSRVVPISTEEFGRPAPRPAYSVLRSERAGAPRLPHWREGLRACLDELQAGRFDDPVPI
jgi:dTDP-4-dehydrorhamnose reductase